MANKLLKTCHVDVATIFAFASLTSNGNAADNDGSVDEEELYSKVYVDFFREMSIENVSN